MVSSNHRIVLAVLAAISVLFVMYTTVNWNKESTAIDSIEAFQLLPNHTTSCPVCPSQPLKIQTKQPEQTQMPKISDAPILVQPCPSNAKPKNLVEAAYDRKYIGCNFWATGGIGNQIWRFASLYGLARYTNREPFFEAKNADQMQHLMELGLTFPMMGEVLTLKSPPEIFLKKYHFADDCCKFDDPKKLIGIPDKYVKIAGDYMQSYKFFHEFRDEIRQIFECGLTVKTSVDTFAKQLFQNDNSHKLCAHIRRGDFIGDLMLESKEDFTVPALKYAFDHIKNTTANASVSMLFIGNDHEFVKALPIQNIGFNQIYMPDSLPRGEDMCLGINHCDSMVMTASGSTFGWWISYLMKPGSTIFYNSQITDFADFTKDVHDFDIFPPDWIMLTLKDNTTYKENLWWHQRRNQKPDLPGPDMQPWV